MIRLIWVLLIVYVIGIGVQLAPTVRDAWDTVPSSQLVSRVVSELPTAAAWPMPSTWEPRPSRRTGT